MDKPECQHWRVTRWIDAGTGMPVDLWACEDCRRRFEPIPETVKEDDEHEAP